MRVVDAVDIAEQAGAGDGGRKRGSVRHIGRGQVGFIAAQMAGDTGADPLMIATTGVAGDLYIVTMTVYASIIADDVTGQGVESGAVAVADNKARGFCGIRRTLESDVVGDVAIHSTSGRKRTGDDRVAQAGFGNGDGIVAVAEVYFGVLGRRVCRRE